MLDRAERRPLTVTDNGGNVQHGHDGWTLEDYDWNEKTGVGTFLYSRVRAADGVIEEVVQQIAQPAAPTHVGWNDRHDY